MHGQDFLPVYYLVLRPDVSGRVALWRERSFGEQVVLVLFPKGKMAIFSRLPSFPSFSLEFRYKLIRLREELYELYDFNLFLLLLLLLLFVKMIIVGRIISNFGKILSSRGIAIFLVAIVIFRFFSDDG